MKMGGVKRVIKKGLGEMGFNAGGGVINWFPGHMAAATRAIRERLKVADLVVEVRDARIPLSSANQDLVPLLSSKRRILALNKKDLANANIMHVSLRFLCFHFSFYIFLIEALCLNCTYILCMSFAHLNALLLQFICKYMLIGLIFCRNGFTISIRASKTASL